MTVVRTTWLVPTMLLLLATGARGGSGGALPDNDVVMKALVEELARSMEELVLDDLPRPFLMRYAAEDRLTFSLRAAYGGILNSNRDRSRSATSRIRVGDFTLDNTNVGRRFGARTALPIDDDYMAIRHAIWGMTDRDYKQAVETLTLKEAYLKQKQIGDRPPDYAPGGAVHAIEPSPEIVYEEDVWSAKLVDISKRFSRFPEIQDSDVMLFAGVANNWIVDSEGTRIRTGDAGAILRLSANTQAPDGMRLRDGKSYLTTDIDDLPDVDEVLRDVDRLCTDLAALADAPVLDHYSGPVLFDAPAAGKVFTALLADGLCARPVPLGSGGRGDRSFEKKLGRRILPRTFTVIDDPGPEMFEGKVLAGAYSFDDEGVKPKRTTLVEKGILKTMLAGRAPTRKIKATTGHARSSGFGDPRVTIGCLYITDESGVSDDALKTALIEAARDEGLDYGLRVSAMEAGGPGSLGPPIHFFKVFVADGHEERVRGMTFQPTESRSMKRILAAGKKRFVTNSTAGASTSIISPAILYDELELTKIEREFDTSPLLKTPDQRPEQAAQRDGD